MPAPRWANDGLRCAIDGPAWPNDGSVARDPVLIARLRGRGPLPQLALPGELTCRVPGSGGIRRRRPLARGASGPSLELPALFARLRGRGAAAERAGFESDRAARVGGVSSGNRGLGEGDTPPKGAAAPLNGAPLDRVLDRDVPSGALP